MSIRASILTPLLAVPLFAGPSVGVGPPTSPTSAVQEAAECEGLDGVRSLLQESRFEAAIETLKKVLAGDPGCAEAHMLLGIAYRTLGSYELIGEAKAELRQAVALDPDLVWARFYLARLYLDFDRKERARAELETALARVPGHPHFLALLGEVHRQMGDPQISVELNRQALRTDPAAVPARYYLGLSLLDLGRAEEAVRELEIAAASDQAIGEMYLGLGTAYLESGSLDQAVEALRKGLEMDPSRPEGRVHLARAYRLQGRFEPALDELRLALPEGTPVQASPYYQRVEADLHFEAGLIHKARGETGEAIASFRRVVSVYPDHEEAHRRLAELLLQEEEDGVSETRREP